jgi:molybdopterin converting factor small subunit
MSKTLWLSKNLSRVARGREGFEVDGDSVGDCINDLISIVPAMKDTLFYQSALNRAVEVQVNKRVIDEGDRLTKSVKDGDEIRVMFKGH